MKQQRLETNLHDQVKNETDAKLHDIWLAGGCFWGVQAFLSRLNGVVETSVGYANGRTENPTYEEVCTRDTGHAETVHVRFDPERLPLEKLLTRFFSIIDPTVRNRQGPDRGTQYRTGIYYLDDRFLPVIQHVIQNIQKKHTRPVVTEVERLIRYDLAEEYHQDYLKKNPGGYCHIDLELMRSAAQEGVTES
ncbi:MAG: peptide-methionine (S)-S-oxide reductase MsrA [Clostridiaceae bacterium]|jgi:methionine-S-sulfoxide reductase|nr:peptide-methionine (S)-S-oxide reductase MsrA [Eubacteriales bacterium]NLV48473.1 peptide-methionine (S)-S-oxide reductase MsrA [Clostridiaceae bacterium]